VLDVDGDAEDALQATGVPVSEGFVGVQEGAALLHATLRVDHLLADHATAATFHLVALLGQR
jgi:hypothetical protein